MKNFCIRESERVILVGGNAEMIEFHHSVRSKVEGKEL